MPVDCIANFNTCLYGEIKPEQGNVLSPWVKITLDKPGAEGQGGSITVGNESFPGSPNTACIKSFEYGKSDGQDLRITIQDEQGGSFVDFAEALLKDYRCNVAPMNMYVEYGWIKSFCEANSTPVKATKIYTVLKAIDTNFSGGKFQFELTGKDFLTIGQEGNADVIIGGDGDEGVTLLDALDQLLKNPDCPPNVGKIEWKAFAENCEDIDITEEEKFKANTDEEKIRGPKRKWEAVGQDKLDVVTRWIGMVEYKDGKRGFIPVFNDTEKNGILEIWVDPKGAHQCCAGTYIVNGGKDSSVIEFNPSFTWNFSNMTSGGGNSSTHSINPQNTPGAKTKGRREEPSLSRAGNPCAGHNTTGATEDQNYQNENGKNGIDEAQSAADKQFRALDLIDGIEADLVVIGDPRLQPMDIYLRFISIIFINPYHLQPSGFVGPLQRGTVSCPDWTIAPPCNPVLSNDSWFVKSVTHKIEAGSYTTTLKVKLAQPGIDIDTSERLGAGQKGWKPPAGCPSSAN